MRRVNCHCEYCYSKGEKKGFCLYNIDRKCKIKNKMKVYDNLKFKGDKGIDIDFDECNKIVEISNKNNINNKYNVEVVDTEGNIISGPIPLVMGCY